MTEQSKPKTLVVATSKTGNTMIVAHAVADAYTAGVLYTPETAPADLSHYDTVLLGFWCDKGDAPADMASFADNLTGKKIGCFATMGGNARDPKALAWMAKTSAALTEKGRGNTLKATFLCRGRIDPVLFDMMTKMAGGLTPEREARRKESETHPDRMDCLNAVAAMAPLFN